MLQLWSAGNLLYLRDGDDPLLHEPLSIMNCSYYTNILIDNKRTRSTQI